MVAREGSGHEVSKSVQKGIAGHKAGGSTRSRRAVGEDRQARIHLRGAGELGPTLFVPTTGSHSTLVCHTLEHQKTTQKVGQAGSWYGHTRSKHQARNLLKCHGVLFRLQPHPEEKRAVCSHCRNSGGL